VRGIQIMCVSPLGAATESDDLVKDLENWFADHQQMCRLMTTSLPGEAREVASDLDRLRASVDSGQRLLGRLKNSFRHATPSQSHSLRQNSSIPLSGMNRFDEARPLSAVNQSSAASATSHRPTHTQSVPGGQTSAAIMGLTPVAAAESPRVLPSRTYLKKSGSGS